MEPHKALVHFITFANTSFMLPTRILEEAMAFRFNSVQAYTEHDISDFLATHSEFVANNPHGFGLWIWKPKVILDALARVNEGEIVLYCDAGMHLNSRGLPRYYEYVDMLKTTDILTFSLNDAYKAQYFVKRDAIDAYYPDFAATIDPYCYAGVMLIKKTTASVQLITDWLGLCERYNLLDRSLSSVPELPCFGANDCDNGLFNLCLAKHRISQAVYPDETNVYMEDGTQSHSRSDDEWEVLHASPFHCRRLRPAK